MKTEFIVLTSIVSGHVGKVALVEVERGAVPAKICPLAKGLVRIVAHRDKLNMGGPKSAFEIAKAEFEADCLALNAKEVGA